MVEILKTIVITNIPLIKAVLFKFIRKKRLALFVKQVTRDLPSTLNEPGRIESCSTFEYRQQKLLTSYLVITIIDQDHNLSYIMAKYEKAVVKCLVRQKSIFVDAVDTLIDCKHII